MNTFDLANILADIAAMSGTDLGSVVLYSEVEDGETHYSHLDTLTVEKYRQGGYVNTYSTKAQLSALWS